MHCGAVRVYLDESMAVVCGSAHVRVWLEDRLPHWRVEQPDWFTREWWDTVPEALREGLEFCPAGVDLSA